MYKVSVGNRTYLVEIKNDQVLVDGKEISWDLQHTGENTYHLISEAHSFRMQVSALDPVKKTMEISINGERIALSIQDRYDLLLEELGMDQSDAHSANQINAPMPGLILEIMVKEGDSVDKGDPLLVLEAMKMENIIKAPGQGVVKSLGAKKGDNVEKNQLLVNFE